jgi:thioester reductase-like protein
MKVLRNEITDIIHVAASISFADEKTNKETNVKGTQNLLELAPSGARLFYVSTAYVAGRATSFREDQLDVGQTFRNNYEQSKFETERLVRNHYQNSRDLLTILRPSIVTGEWETGRTFQFMTLYKVLHGLVTFARRYPQGTFSMEYNPTGTQNYIPVDRLTDMSEEIVMRPSSWGKTYHLVNEKPIVNTEFKFLLEDMLGIQIQNTPPDQTSIPLNRAAVAGNAAYLAYLNGEPTFDCTARNSLLSSRQPMTFDRQYLERLISYCESTTWGKTLAVCR